VDDAPGERGLMEFEKCDKGLLLIAIPHTQDRLRLIQKLQNNHQTFIGDAPTNESFSQLQTKTFDRLMLPDALRNRAAGFGNSRLVQNSQFEPFENRCTECHKPSVTTHQRSSHAMLSANKISS